jgi:hypothetical protein
MYYNIKEDTNEAAIQTNAKKTSSHTLAPKKGLSSLKKRLYFDSNLKSLINYNLSTFTPFTLVRAAYDEDLLLGIKRIKLATLDELARFLQKKEF